jgi:carbon starvation protein CstA
LFAVMVLAVIVGLASQKLRLALWAVTGVALVLMVAAICAGVRRPVPIYPVFLPVETRAEYDKAAEAASEGKLWFLAERGMPDLLTEAEMRRWLAEYQEPRPVARLLRPELPASFARYIYATGGFDMEEHVLGRVSDEDQAVRLTEGAAGKARTMWTLVLLACAFVAAVLPRWLLLEPRNYLNSFLLYGGMGLMVLGLVVLRPAVAAPAMRGGSADGPGLSLVPLLLVSIAGGAVSGLHAVVGAGSTARQLDNERHARLIGYGGMVGGAALAVLVVLACSAAVACLSGESVARAGSDEEARERWLGAYGSPGDTEWSALGTVVRGGAVLISQAGLLVADNGIPLQPAVAFASLVVLSFAVTALDAGARLLRHNIEELASGDGLRFMGNRFVAAGLGVLAMAPFAFSNAGLSLWHVLGASNLLLAALVLLVATVYLFKRGAWIWYTALPMVVVAAVAIWALGIKLRDFAAAQEWGLLAVVIALLCLALWLAVEGAIAWRRAARKGRSGQAA